MQVSFCLPVDGSFWVYHSMLEKESASPGPSSVCFLPSALVLTHVVHWSVWRSWLV